MLKVAVKMAATIITLWISHSSSFVFNKKTREINSKTKSLENKYALSKATSKIL